MKRRQTKLSDSLSRTASVLASGMLILLMMGDTLHGQLIVAHRGASLDAPENTLAAFQLAWQQGADVIEGDFYLTKDRQIVCIHDENTKRTAGVSRIVAQSTLAELRVLDVGRWKNERYTGEKIPTLQEVLATVPKGKRIFIEIKCGPEIVPVLRASLARGELHPRQIAVIAFRTDVITASKQQMPHIKAYWLTSYDKNKIRGTWSPSIEEVLTTLRRTRADGLDTKFEPAVVNPAFVRRLREVGMEFHCWTVDKPSDAAQLQMFGVDSMTTNRPEFIRRELPTQGLYDKLDLHLKLDGDLKDSSSQHRMTSFVGRTPRFQRAVWAQGLDLQTKNGTVSVHCKLPPTGSICMWYYARDWYDFQTVFDNSADQNAWECWIYETGELRFRANPEGAVVSHAFHPRGDVNEWHHIAITWDRRDKTTRALRLYVNGHLSDSAGWKPDHWMTAGNQLHLGGGHRRNNPGIGMWDDVAVFRTMLRPADIRQIINGGVQSLMPLVPPTEVLEIRARSE